MASENPEFGATLARRLNQSRASAVLQSNLIAIEFGTAEARCLNWALFQFFRELGHDAYVNMMNFIYAFSSALVKIGV